MNKHDTCVLCHKKKKLCLSHIIPEFFFKPLYDEKHRFLKIPLAEEKKTQYGQKGLREKLLCKECESHLSKYEKYACEIFSGKAGTYKELSNLIKFKDLDYKKFKLFQMSLLFRASVSSLEFFEKIDIGPHEETIREMLINENPGKKCDYPAVILVPLMKNKPIPKDFISPPVEISKFEGHRRYRFILGGYFWVYMVSSHTQMFNFREFFLDESGELLMPVADADIFFRGLAKDMFGKKKQNK
jgi:hypothetical protein